MKPRVQVRSNCLRIAAMLVMAGPLAGTAHPDERKPAFEIGFELDLDHDDGRSLGSLFEIVGKDGRTLVSAGFERNFNTKAGANHRQLILHALTDATNRVDDLGQPFDANSNVRLFSHRGRLFAYRYEAPGPVKFYDAAATSWTVADQSAFGGDREDYIAAIQVVGNGLLVFRTHDVFFEGERLDLPALNASEQIVSALYFDSRLHLFSFAPDTRQGTYLSCPWLPGEKGSSSCRDTPPARRSHEPLCRPWPRQARRRVGRAGFDNGDVLFFGSDTKDSTVLRHAKGPDGEHLGSWQIYSSLEWRNEILLGHYPSGNAVALRGGAFEFVEPPVPFHPQTSNVAREAQSLGLFRGRIAVGMWPWGEVWTGLPGEGWALETRAFDAPDYSATEAPYGELVAKTHSSIPFNSLGQRIFHFATHADGLALSTSGKHHKLTAAYDSLHEAERAQYGRVLMLRSADQRACPLDGPWPRSLTVRVFPDAAEVSDGDGPVCGVSWTTGGPSFEGSRLIALTGPYGPGNAAAMTAK